MFRVGWSYQHPYNAEYDCEGEDRVYAATKEEAVSEFFEDRCSDHYKIDYVSKMSDSYA